MRSWNPSSNRRDLASTPHRATRRVTCALIALMGFLSSGCFLTSLFVAEPKKASHPSSSLPPVEPIPPPPPQTTLEAARLVRRISLDLLGKAPAAKDVELVAADVSTYPKLIDDYASTQEATLRLASMFQNIWELDDDKLRKLDELADEDPSLAAALTPALRREIVAEPWLQLRWLMEQKKPFGELYKSNFAIMHKDVVALFGLSDDGTPWPAEPYRFVPYRAPRPAGGILVGLGLLSAVDDAHDPAQRHRAAQVLTRQLCLTLEQSDAHKFQTLSAADLKGDLAEIANRRSPCRGCHAQFEDPSKMYRGIAVGDTLTEWVKSGPADPAAAGTYAGHSYGGMAGLASYLAMDPRSIHCAAQKLGASLLQRPFGTSDGKLIAQMLDQTQMAGDQLTATARFIMKQVDYQISPTATEAIDANPRGTSGVRLLQRVHWRGLLAQLSSSSHQLSFPPTLDPGSEELLARSDAIPSGNYWRAVDQLARDAAQLIVSEELSAGRLAATRRVFTELPDGTAVGAKPTARLSQIKKLWQQLTGELLDDAAPLLADLQLLTAEAASQDTAADVASSWQAVLIAMLTHPAFLMY